MRTDAMSYAHRQLSIIPLAVIAAVLLIVFLIDGEMIMNSVLPWVIIALVAFVMLIFTTLTVRVDERALSWHFAFGLLGRSVFIKNIAEVQPARSKWWEGIGSRSTSRGWLYNVGGLNAVEITKRDGNKFRLGTNEPTALIEALRARLEK